MIELWLSLGYFTMEDGIISLPPFTLKYGNMVLLNYRRVYTIFV